MKRYEQHIELKLLCKIQVRGPLQENPGTSSHVQIYIFLWFFLKLKDAVDLVCT